MYREMQNVNKENANCHCCLGRANSAGNWLMPVMAEEHGSRAPACGPVFPALHALLKRHNLNISIVDG